MFDSHGTRYQNVLIYELTDEAPEGILLLVSLENKKQPKLRTKRNKAMELRSLLNN